MSDYWLTRELLHLAGWIYVALFGAVVAIALWVPKQIWLKLVLGGFSAGLMSIPFSKAIEEEKQEQTALNIYQTRFAKAKALFEERCKSTGPKVYRTVDGVEGVLLKNIRNRGFDPNRGDRMWEDAGLPNERSGDDYIRSFLYFENHEDKRRPRGYITSNKTNLNGYKFVDVETAGSPIQRYQLSTAGDSKLIVSATSGKPARYAVSFTNLMNEDDRDLWIAGTRVSITDTETSEVMAEHTWYSWEQGFGSTAGHRQPWGFAVTCPEDTTWGGTTTRMFVDQVLKPKAGD